MYRMVYYKDKNNIKIKLVNESVLDIALELLELEGKRILDVA